MFHFSEIFVHPSIFCEKKIRLSADSLLLYCHLRWLDDQKGINRSREGIDVSCFAGYGMTECCGLISITPRDHAKDKPGSVGVPLPAVEVKVSV